MKLIRVLPRKHASLETRAAVAAVFLSVTTASGAQPVPPALATQAIPLPLGAAHNGPSYADLADLADSAPVVAKVQIRKATRLKEPRAAGVAARHARYYIEGSTLSVITAGAPIASDIRYLVDVPLDAKDKPPKLKKTAVLVFGKAVPGNASELQLVAPGAQLPWSPSAETRVRTIVSELVAPDAPGQITRVREVIHVPGSLEGEGETQIFLATRDGSAASLSILHTPGEPPRWGASFSEVTAQIGQPPARDTLAWYRLACFLPKQLPANAHRSETEASSVRAEADYRMVLADLGACLRTRKAAL